MTNPQLLLHLAHAIIGAPSREHAYVMPDSADLWGSILKGIAEHQAQAQQTTPQPFLWTDADSADTAGVH